MFVAYTSLHIRVCVARMIADQNLYEIRTLTTPIARSVFDEQMKGQKFTVKRDEQTRNFRGYGVGLSLFGGGTDPSLLGATKSHILSSKTN